MKFYKWNLIGKGFGRWENHVFPRSFFDGKFIEPISNQFIALCNLYSPALNAENKDKYYCSTCALALASADRQAQDKEQARINKLELKRLDAIQEINNILNLIPIDDLLNLLSTLKNKKN